MNSTILNSNNYGPLAEETLQAFESELQAKLPDDYRTFLLQHNGGTPNPACFLVPDDPLAGEESPQSETQVVVLFSLHYNEWSDSTLEGSLAFPLQEAWQDLLTEQPESNWLPIGKDWSGNYICLAYGTKENGHVYFYNHDYEVATPLATSFDQFLANLKLCTENDE